MEIEKASDYDLSSESFSIENHYKGIYTNLGDIYKDIPLLIEAAPTNKKALLSLISYFETIRFVFDFFAYQTPHTQALLTNIPWQQFPLKELQQQTPETPDEKYYYGILYYCNRLKKYRIGTKNSRKRGLSLLEESANAGFLKAMHYLGTIARLEKNKTKALSWNSKASEEDYIPSIFELGYMMLKNTDDQQKISQAVSYITKAADSNYATAHFYLALLYDSKTRFTSFTDTAKAQFHYKHAASLGCLQAQHNLGMICLQGTEKNNDIIEGLHTINKAARCGYAPSQTYLGLLYCSGIYLNRNPLKGIELLTHAAVQDNSAACFHLAKIYILGDITNQDIPKGIKLLNKSVNANNIHAQYQLGIFYLHAIHVDKNTNKAVQLLSKSASKGYCNAQYVLGKLYTEGTIIKQDNDLGKKLLNAAAEQNYQEAIEYLKNHEIT